MNLVAFLPLLKRNTTAAIDTHDFTKRDIILNFISNYHSNFKIQ